MFSKSKNDNLVSTAAKNFAPIGKTKPGKPANKQGSKTTKTETLSPTQIKAILKDTEGVIHFQKQDEIITPGITDNEAKASGASSLKVKTPAKKPVSVTAENPLKVQYTVTDTTYFHDQPNGSGHRKSFLDPLNKNILTPIYDKNGFIYIVYTNRFGRTSKGWINKKDLRPLR